MFHGRRSTLPRALFKDFLPAGGRLTPQTKGAKGPPALALKKRGLFRDEPKTHLPYQDLDPLNQLKPSFVAAHMYLSVVPVSFNVGAL